jgi:hypothetical protein
MENLMEAIWLHTLIEQADPHLMPITRLVLMLPPRRLPKQIHLELSGTLGTWWMAKRFVSCRKKVQKQLWGDESYAKHFVSR